MVSNRDLDNSNEAFEVRNDTNGDNYRISSFPENGNEQASYRPVRLNADQRKVSGRFIVVTLFFVVAASVFLGAWYLGYIDRWLFETTLEKAVDSADLAVSDSDASSVNRDAGLIGGQYAYTQLSEEDQKKYRLVLTAIETRSDQPYPTDDMADLEHIFQCIQADHPELFDIDGVSMETVKNRGSGLVESVTVRGRYAYSEEESQAINAQLDAAINQCLAGLPADVDDYGKSKYLYEWLATNVVYDRATAATTGLYRDGAAEHNTSQTIEGALLKGSAVCSGYAETYQLLLQRLGIPCCYVTGTGNGGLHAWCVVFLDGAYYYVDPTWADPQSEGDGQELGYVNYDYLNVTTDELCRTHEISCPYELPQCDAAQDNYYVREGLLFDSADEQRFGTLAGEAVSAGTQLQVRFTNPDDYKQIRDYFVGNGRLGSYMPGQAYRYTFSDPNWSIVILG